MKKPIGRILSPSIVRIGGGVSNEIGTVLKELGLENPLIVTDKNLIKIGHLSKLTAIMDKARFSYSVFNEVVEDPTDLCLTWGLEKFKSANFDSIIGFGGGSSMDLAKAISAMSINQGHVRKYKAPAQVNHRGVPVILIPTTGGTGSELTSWCVITDTQMTEKYNLSGMAFLATAAIIDWEFTLTKPARLTADTAIDSLTHAIEAYVGKKSSPYTDMFALASIPLITANIRKAFNDPDDANSRASLMLGASKAGFAFSNASVALVHGMSRPIGAHFHVAHGLSNAILLPTVTKFSINHAPSRYADCARAASWAKPDDSDTKACMKLVEGLVQLNQDVRVPSLEKQGHSKTEYNKKIPLMAAQALASGSPQNNPRVPNVDEIMKLYEEIW